MAEAKRYPDIQNTFFERATAAVRCALAAPRCSAECLPPECAADCSRAAASRRDAMYSFLAFSSTGALLLWGAKGSKDAKLPVRALARNIACACARARARVRASAARL